MFKKSENPELDRAKRLVKYAIKLALIKNPEYAMPIQMFCAAVSGDSKPVEDVVKKALADYEQEAAVSLLLADMLKDAGFFNFADIEQSEILREICGIVS